MSKQNHVPYIVRAGGGGGSGAATPHALLDGVQDNDTLAAAPVAGDLITANATPLWSRLAIGGANTVLKVVAGAVAWAQVAFSELTGTLSNTQHGALDSVTASHSVFAEGVTHFAGFVPDPGVTPGTAKFLREDASFAAPPGTPHALLDGNIDSDTLAAGPTSQDLIVANATPKWARFAAGTLNQVLGMAAGPVVQWLTLLKAHLPATVVYNDQANTYSAGAQSLASAASLIVPIAGGSAPTANGDLRFDSTQLAFSAGGNGAINGKIPRVLSVQNSTTDTLTNSGVGVQVFATTFQLPANFFIVKKCVRLTVGFEMTPTATVPTYQWSLRLEKSGPVDTNIWQNPALAPAAQTKRGFAFIFMLQCLTTGVTGTIVCHAPVMTAGSLVLINSLSQPIIFDTTTAQTIQMTIQFGGTGSNNPVTLEQMIIEELN